MLCAIAVLAAPAVQAQGTAGDKTVKVRFRLYGWDEPVTDLCYNMRGKDETLVIYQDTRSVFYDYTGPELITFYRLKTDSTGKVVREPAAQTNLHNAGPWPLIIFANHQAKPGTYQTIVMKDDLAAFPPGSYAFSNFTPSVIGGVLGTEDFKLSPGESKLVAGKPPANGTTLAAMFYQISGSEKVPVYTSNWAIRPAIRTRVFVRSSPDTPTGIVARRLVESTFFQPEKAGAISTGTLSKTD